MRKALKQLLRVIVGGTFTPESGLGALPKCLKETIHGCIPSPTFVDGTDVLQSLSARMAKLWSRPDKITSIR
jgi:hypothetical protein